MKAIIGRIQKQIDSNIGLMRNTPRYKPFYDSDLQHLIDRYHELTAEVKDLEAKNKILKNSEKALLLTIKYLKAAKKVIANNKQEFDYLKDK